jgi:hypothetical protein
MSWLLLRLNVGGPLTGILVVGFAVHPAFILYGNWLFYTLPVAAVLIAGAVALSRFDETGLMRFAHYFGWLACIAMLTRTAFHALWLLILVPGIAALLPVERRRGFVAACIGPLIVVTMCYANVWWRSGVYGPSSWIGMNLAKGWDIPQADAAGLVARGALPPIWTCGPFMWPGRYEDLGYFRGSGRSNPAIDEPYKSTGYPNFNHSDYARISRELLIEDMMLIRTRPDLYLRRIVRALDQFTIPGPTLFLVRYDTRRIEWASAAASSLLPRVALLLGLVGGVAAGARFALQRSRPRHDRVVLAYLVATVVWLTACSTLVEIGENDRIRWEIDPLIVVLVGYTLRSTVGGITDRSER